MWKSIDPDSKFGKDMAPEDRCWLDVMDLQGFPDDVIVFGKDWFEHVPTIFNLERGLVGFAGV